MADCVSSTSLVFHQLHAIHFDVIQDICQDYALWAQVDEFQILSPSKGGGLE